VLGDECAYALGRNVSRSRDAGDLVLGGGKTDVRVEPACRCSNAPERA
jgi:hypothetical protein